MYARDDSDVNSAFFIFQVKNSKTVCLKKKFSVVMCYSVENATFFKIRIFRNLS